LRRRMTKYRPKFSHQLMSEIEIVITSITSEVNGCDI